MHNFFYMKTSNFVHTEEQVEIERAIMTDKEHKATLSDLDAWFGVNQTVVFNTHVHGYDCQLCICL